MSLLSRALGRDKPAAAKRINLALQGGGTHGAFTWGVLDHLLEDGGLTIDGISGTSAGAVNAVMLADGLGRSDRAGSRIDCLHADRAHRAKRRLGARMARTRPKASKMSSART